jgi:pimeloyl-ACP methyl ester carboxylesterase
MLAITQCRLVKVGITLSILGFALLAWAQDFEWVTPERVGAPDAPALVLGHGVGSSARFVVAACAAPVVAAGWRLVAFGQRGHGGSTACPDVADHHLDVYAGDLVRVVAAVRGTIAAVGGVSLGGHAAVRAALAVPRVVCLPAWSGSSVPGEGPHAAVAEEVRAIGVAAVTDRLAGDAQLPTWLRDTLVTDYRRHDAGSLRAALLALDGGQAPTDAEVAAVGEPVAVVGWPDDPGHPLAVAERWARLARRGTLTTTSLTDPEVDLTRFGAAVVHAVRTVADPR